jgi:autotransporter adhesin
VGFNAAAGGEYSTAIGEGADATGLQSTAIGGATSTGGFTNSVALGYGTTNTADSQVAVGGRTVTQLANATLNATSTDAVTGQQLFATNQTIATQGVAIADLQISDTVQTSQIAGLDTRVTALETLSGNLGALQGSVDQLFDLRHRDRRDMKQGVAAAMAMADAPMPSRPGGVSYQVKAGTFRGEHAISGALTYRLNTSSPMAVSAGVSHAGNKNTGANIAFSGEF